jgi:DNA-nicking Smr family endonuclease
MPGMDKQPLDDDEVQIFRQAMRQLKGLKPMYCDVIMPQSNPVPPIPMQRERELLAIRDEMLSDRFEPYYEVETGEELVFLRSGVQRKILHKLRRGFYSVEAELDLHGMIVPEARRAVVEFLHYCQAKERYCVRIVHGKGYGSSNKLPVLKNKLNHWLRQRDEILAFCSARQFDGGTGAIYVLLKK